MTTTNELKLSLLPPEFSADTLLPEALFLLLKERAARYTMGDSASVPYDTAQRLLEGILYCVALYEKDKPNNTGADALLRARWMAGVARAKQLARRARLLLREAERLQPPVTNASFRESLSALPAFFRAYDADFFAQELPCSLDYPLCHPVSDALNGVEFLLDYLRRWLTESAFLRCFPADALYALYERYYVDYDDLVVNLYLPAAEMAVLCALAGGEIRLLSLDPAALRAASQALRGQERAAKDALLCAAERAVDELNIAGDFSRAYLRDTALDLLIRVRAGHTESLAAVTSV